MGGSRKGEGAKRGRVIGWLLHILTGCLGWELGWRIVGIEPDLWMSSMAGVVMALQWAKAQEDD